MRLEDMLKSVSGITNKTIKANCWDGQFNVLEGLQAIQSKVNEIIVAINDGVIKGDKGDTPNVQVGETTQLQPNEQAYVKQTGDMLNPVLNFGIPKGDKGDKGDTGKTSESINDGLTDLDHTWSSQKIVDYSNNMFNNLKDIQGVKYSCDNSYKVLTGTKNGVVKDLKLSGKSLVNLGGKANVTVGTYSPVLTGNINLFKPLQKYTFIVKNNLQHAVKIYTNEYQFSSTPRFKTVEPNSTFMFTDTTLSELKLNDNVIIKAGNETSSIYRLDILILEGDHTQNPPQYFEGIASVGNGNGIEVLSVNSNLFNEDTVSIGKGLSSDNGTLYEQANRNTSDYIKVYKGSQIYINSLDLSTIKGRVFYNNDKTFNNSFVGNSFTPNQDGFIRFSYDNQIEKLNIMVNLGTTKPYIKHKQDKKPILFKDTDGQWKPVTVLRGLDLNSCDTIEKHSDDKHYLHVRNGKEVLNGTQNIVLDTAPTPQNNTLAFNVIGLNRKFGVLNLICDKLVVEDVYSIDKEGIRGYTSSSGIFIRINKSKLETQDVNGFKKWLQSNNVVIIYQLAQEKVYEVNPLELESFDNETMILFNTGVISPKSEFYVDSNLGSLMLDTIDRTTRLENEVFKVNTAMLRGDMRYVAEVYYPQDFIKEEK